VFSLGVVACELLTGANPHQLDLLPRRDATSAAPVGAHERWTCASLRMREFILFLSNPVCLRRFSC
jgi:hypothetical protein